MLLLFSAHARVLRHRGHDLFLHYGGVAPFRKGLVIFIFFCGGCSLAKVGYRCGVALLSWRVSLSCRGLIDSAPAPIICSAFALGCLALCFLLLLMNLMKAMKWMNLMNFMTSMILDVWFSVYFIGYDFGVFVLLPL